MAYREAMQKKMPGGAKSDYDGISMPRSTRSADDPKMESKWQGKVKGKTKHTYSVEDIG